MDKRTFTVVGIDTDGRLICEEGGKRYNCGETLAEFGEHNLTEAERRALKLDTHTVDITPKWAGLMPILLAIMESSDDMSQKTMIREELMRCARAADAWVAYCKARSVGEG